jgi:5-hydroxyisourate hydrolase
MAKLTLHVLDMLSGNSANQMSVEVICPNGKTKRVKTGLDGRVSKPILEDEAFPSGLYQMIFDLKDYYQACGLGEVEFFMDRAIIEFKVLPNANYHLPLIITPWSYSVYRGS